VRLFVAVNIPEEIEEKISETQSHIKRALCDVSPVRDNGCIAEKVSGITPLSNGMYSSRRLNLVAFSNGVKWVGSERFHVTLKFLGEVPESMLPQVYEALSKSVAGSKPFNVSIEGAGAFPDINRPRVIWAGIGSGKQELAAIASKLDENFEPLGFAVEKRPFSPHLTLGRVRSLKNVSALSKIIAPLERTQIGSFSAASVDLMQSILRPEGPQYLCLRSNSI